MKLEVKKNAKRNILAGILNKVVLLILPFVSRAIICNILGSEYLGLNSLFTSILTVLSLSELGFSSAMVYHMYRPIVEDDYKTINSLLNLYRKVYRVIGMAITLLGLCLLPFLNNFINGAIPKDVNIYCVFLIQLSDTAISYFLFGYKQSLLVAYQREDINSWINLIAQAGLKFAQIALLVVTHDYYFFICCIPVFTIVNNILINFFTKRLYPFAKCEGELESNILNSIKKLVAGAFIQKACDATRNSLDSICVSAFIGLTLTAVYSNYYTIFSSLNLLLTVFITAISAGIGNHVVTKSVYENFEELKKIDFLYLLLHGWCTVNLLCIVQPFMTVWMGDEMLFSIRTVLLFALYFYIGGIGKVRAIYYSAKGMWWEMRYRSIAETIANVVLNIGLGYFFGINGIILATVISLIFVNFLWGNRILFSNYFGIKYLKEYYLYQAKYFSITFVISFLMFMFTNHIHINNVYLDLMLKTTLSVCGSTVLFIVVYFKNNTFRDAVSMVLNRKID